MYSCGLCKIKTKNKSNFITHLSTNKHKEALLFSGARKEKYEITEIPEERETAPTAAPTCQENEPTPMDFEVSGFT